MEFLKGQYNAQEIASLTHKIHVTSTTCAIPLVLISINCTFEPGEMHWTADGRGPWLADAPAALV